MNVRGEGYYFWRERDLGGRLLAGGERYGEVAGREPIFGGRLDQRTLTRRRCPGLCRVSAE